MTARAIICPPTMIVVMYRRTDAHAPAPMSAAAFYICIRRARPPATPYQPQNRASPDPRRYAATSHPAPSPPPLALTRVMCAGQRCVASASHRHETPALSQNRAPGSAIAGRVFRAKLCFITCSSTPPYAQIIQRLSEHLSPAAWRAATDLRCLANCAFLDHGCKIHGATRPALARPFMRRCTSGP